VFHYLRAPRAALAEMRRVLRPGGEAIVTDWCDDFLACRVCDALLRAFSRSHFRTYGREECGRLLVDAGLIDVRVEAYKVDWLWGLMTARATKPR
jgi:SAM-dependent methyltransferase